MKKILGMIGCSLLVGCQPIETKVIAGPAPGIEYHNQNTAPWPWVSVVPSERALALKEVEFEDLSHQLHFAMSFDPYQKAFSDVRLVLLDYTVLPRRVSEKMEGIPKINKDRNRPKRYFMVASFYKIGNRPPSPPDFEVTASLRVDKAGPQEAMYFMIHEIVEDVITLCNDGLLTPGRKITVNLD